MISDFQINNCNSVKSHLELQLAKIKIVNNIFGEIEVRYSQQNISFHSMKVYEKYNDFFLESYYNEVRLNLIYKVYFTHNFNNHEIIVETPNVHKKLWIFDSNFNAFFVEQGALESIIRNECYPKLIQNIKLQIIKSARTSPTATWKNLPPEMENILTFT